MRIHNLLIRQFGLRFVKSWTNKHFLFHHVVTVLPASCFSATFIFTVNSSLGQIMRFFSNPRKPMILALARPDPKKNLVTLVKAFGECRPLRELANLVSHLLYLLFRRNL